MLSITYKFTHEDRLVHTDDALLHEGEHSEEKIGPTE